MKWYAAAFPHSRLPIAVMVLVATGAAVWFIPSFQYDEDPRTLFRSRDASYAELESLFEEFGRDDLDCLIVLESDGFLTAENVQVVPAGTVEATTSGRGRSGRVRIAWAPRQTRDIVGSR